MNPSEPERDDATDVPAAATPARSDPERGFRGVMAAALVLQAITLLLGLPVAATGAGLAGWELAVILTLAAACVAAAGLVRRPFAVPLIIGLQVAAVGTWVIDPALGVMGLVFAVVWWTLLHWRAEYRRRLAAGVLPLQRAAGGEPPEDGTATPTRG